MDPPSPSRKFIDLILRATSSSKWANWDPSYEIKVGDYGQVDRETGKFDRKGNIYDNTDIYEDEDIAKLVKENPPISAAREDLYIESSVGVKRSNFISNAETEVLGLADAPIKGQWTFGSKRAALLIMDHPRISHIPPNTFLERLVKVQAMKDMCLVSEAFSCPAYGFYLSNGGGEAINLALIDAPRVTVGGEPEGKWIVQNAPGLFRGARDEHGKDSFTPLYVLKEIRKGKRRYAPDPVGDDLWCSAQTPWDPLDNIGHEELFEDTVFE